MSITSPEALCAEFVRRFTAGDLDALVALYEPNAVLVPQPGTVARGHGAIRAALEGFLAMKGRFRMTPPRVIPGEGLAVMVCDWTLDATGPDGNPLHLTGQTCDVARRQGDGSWRYAIDSPFGPAGAA